MDSESQNAPTAFGHVELATGGCVAIGKYILSHPAIFDQQLKSLTILNVLCTEFRNDKEPMAKIRTRVFNGDIRLIVLGQLLEEPDNVS
jgi:hypothetical protein